MTSTTKLRGQRKSLLLPQTEQQCILDPSGDTRKFATSTYKVQKDQTFASARAITKSSGFSLRIAFSSMSAL